MTSKLRINVLSYSASKANDLKSQKTNMNSRTKNRALEKKVKNQKTMPYLFSYGTLQQESVQISIFSRLLEGSPENLIGFIIAKLQIQDKEVIRQSEKEFHPIAKQTGSFHNRIPGKVFAVSEEELISADCYEVDSYQRILTTLESGKSAWVYV
jgi:hypothetical protein